MELTIAIQTLHVPITMVDIRANVILGIKVTVSHALTLTNAPLVPTTATRTPNAQIIRVCFHVDAILVMPVTVLYVKM